MCLNRIRDPPGTIADQFLTEAAVQLDIPMKESDLTQPKEVSGVGGVVFEKQKSSALRPTELQRNLIERLTWWALCPLLSSSMAGSNPKLT